MSLPTLNAPEHKIKLVSVPKSVKFRPYIMGEEKILMMAKQGEDPAEIEDAVRQIVRACTFGKIDMTKLPSFDLEYLFVQIRAKSVNNVVTIFFECHNRPKTGAKDDGQCHAQVPVQVNLDEVKLTVPKEHTNKVWLTDDVGVQLRYPTSDLFAQYSLSEEAEMSELLLACLETVFMKDGTVHELKDEPKDNIKAFIAQMTFPQVMKIRESFFDTMPHLTHTVHFKCPKCEYEEDIVLSGLMDFFD